MINFKSNFIKFVYENVLSEQSRSTLIEKLNNTIIKIDRSKNTKIFVKRKPQQVIIFVRKNGKNFTVIAYQFGKSDYITGRKKNHITTINNILLEKTREELEKLY